jgi:hypothetical protein
MNRKRKRTREKSWMIASKRRYLPDNNGGALNRSLTLSSRAM